MGTHGNVAFIGMLLLHRFATGYCVRLQAVKRSYSGAEVLKTVLEDVNAEPESDVECNTLLEAAEIAGSDERPLDIVIIPPSSTGAVSDVQTFDDDN